MAKETPTERWTDADEDQKNYAIAQSAAAYAHLAYFSSRRGILPSDAHYVVIYDNNMYSGQPERRDIELAKLVQEVADFGTKLLARAEYPAIDKYTVALVFGNNGIPKAREGLDATLILSRWKKVLAWKL